MISSKERRSRERKSRLRFEKALRKLKRMDFRGGTFEIELDCSFGDIFVRHVRATIVSISWRYGKPYKIRFACPVEFFERGKNEKIVWSSPELNEIIYIGIWNCQLHIPGFLGAMSAFRGILEKGGGFGFRDTRGAGIFLYQKGVKLPERPGFHETVEERNAFMEIFSEKAAKALAT